MSKINSIQCIKLFVAYSEFLTVLENEPQLYELHTHLLGMGNAGFWVDTILCDEKIMPTNDTFRHNPQVRRTLCRLIWNSGEKPGFIQAEKTAKFLNFLTENNDIPYNSEQARKNVKASLEKKFGTISSIFWHLIENEKFNKEQLHRGMSFGRNFSYDVVLTLEDLAKGLNIDIKNGRDIAQMKIAEKLGIYLSKSTKSIEFKHWIIFNARSQEFEIVYGIVVEDLRKLIMNDTTAPDKAKQNARAHIVNAFSMCDAQGTAARHVDFHNFRGAFTPEFYPRRFALKDSIYSQRLDVLASLLYHVFKRYQTCLPPVKYCEFSVGVGDLSRPWVFDVLRSFSTDPKTSEATEESSTYTATEASSSFSQCVRKKHFPYLEVAFKLPDDQNGILSSIPNVTYKFLAGFDRTNVGLPLLKDQNHAVRLLNDSPQRAITLMRKEIENSEKSVEESKLFKKTPEESEKHGKDNMQKLEILKKTAEKIPYFYDWIVGIDLFGDELGYPYCPFVTYPFITYINDVRNATDKGKSSTRKKYPRFGVRFHCGENVQYADNDASAYRSFIAHMYIVFGCLRYLRYKLDHGIRIGHGIGFERILGDSMDPSTHRKSSVLRAEMRHQAPKLFENIAFEVNITSNEYLLGDHLRQGNYAQTHCFTGLLRLKAPIILSTDDDGIWPIDQCSFIHPGHHSLTAEYCRAISSGLLTKPSDVKTIVDNSKQYCFCGTENDKKSATYDLSRETFTENTIILHPDLIEHILRRLGQISKWEKNAIELLKDAKKRALTPDEVLVFKYEILRQTTGMNQLHQETEDRRQISDEFRKQEDTILTNAERRALEDGEILKLKETRGLDKGEDLSKPFYQKYSSYFPEIRDHYTYEDENLWREEYRSIAQVAYVCTCIQSGSIGPNGETKMPEEYRWLFKNDENGNIFKYICSNWRLIDDQFIKSKPHNEEDTTKNYRHVLIYPLSFFLKKDQLSNTTEQTREVAIVSPTCDEDKLSSNHSSEIGYIRAQQQRSQTIVVYIDSLNIDVAQNPWKNLLKQIGLEKVSVEYYTNYDKDKFIHIESDGKLEIAVNPKSTQRDRNEKNFLYALCQYAPAATTALRFISEQINPKSHNPESIEIVAQEPDFNSSPHVAEAGALTSPEVQAQLALNNKPTTD